MLATQVEYRGKGIATKLVDKAIGAMDERKAEEVCASQMRGIQSCPSLLKIFFSFLFVVV